VNWSTVLNRQQQAIRRLTYSWSPVRLLPMLPHEGTKKFVSHYLLNASRLFCVFVAMSIFSEVFHSG
jgi:hypothetical protein